MHAYLIIAHEQFDLLESLLKCIDDARNDIYIHIDSRSELDIGRIEKVLRNSRIEFVPRIHIRWGGFDMVRCEYMLLEAAFENGHEYEYVHLISGADLPLKTRMRYTAISMPIRARSLSISALPSPRKKSYSASDIIISPPAEETSSIALSQRRRRLSGVCSESTG